MTSSTKWLVAIFVVVAAFAAGMLLPEKVANGLNPRNILANFDGLPESDMSSTATSGQLTLPEAGQGAASVPKPLPQVGGNNLLLNPGGGNVGIGTFSPGRLLTLESADADIEATTISDVNFSTIRFKRARVGPSIVQENDVAATFAARAFDGDDYRFVGQITFTVDGTPGADMPGRIEFRTPLVEGAAEEIKMVIKNDGNVGIGTTAPQSALQVSGYTQLDLTTSAPPAADCDEASERGRMKVDNAAGLLFICVDSGWVSK